jgi:hypothetical protein
MKHGKILDVGSAADTDEVYVSARYNVIPDAALGTDLHVSDDHCGFGDEDGGIDSRVNTLE